MNSTKSYIIRYPNKRWRHDADGHYRYIGSGGGALAAVLGVIGASVDQPGQWWAGVEKERSYHATSAQAQEWTEHEIAQREEPESA